MLHEFAFFDYEHEDDEGDIDKAKAQIQSLTPVFCSSNPEP
jgi:hypothetical protein